MKDIMYNLRSLEVIQQEMEELKNGVVSNRVWGYVEQNNQHDRLLYSRLKLFHSVGGDLEQYNKALIEERMK